MRKGVFRGIGLLLCLLMASSLCGCAEIEPIRELLQSRPFETSVVTEQENIEGSSDAKGQENSKEEAEVKETKTVEERPNLLYDGGVCFAYQNLNEAEQIWYRDIAESLGLMQEEKRLDKAAVEQGLDETDIDKIFQCVLTDHPELFYVEGYTYTKYTRGEKIVGIDFAGTFSMDEEQMLVRKAEIEQKAQVLLDGAAGLSDDYAKVKYVYDTLIRITEYDLDAPDNQNIYSVFVNGRSVCQGYAKAVQYLLERMGVECTLVQGIVDTGEGHAWNLVKVNGSYYYLDATWGDASYLPNEDGSTSAYVPEINYDYLCVTTQQLLRTHILSSCVPMPDCVDEKDNYYVREGALFVSYDKEQMRALFERFLNRGKPDVTVKCADEECYREIMTALIDEQEIFDYLTDENDTIAYTHNEKQLSMTFWVTNE